MHLEPELFMVMFIAPLLFADSRKANKVALWRLKFPVLLLALGLVFFTVLILGFALKLFAPSIPLAAAFALAAALAPTDAVSVATLKKSARISSEQSKLLQGESLLNDASSIVSFNFAIAAVITGSFSVWEAEGIFLFKFLGGLALGIVVMLIRYGLIRFLRSRGIESVSFHVLFEIITPFLVYLLAEFIGVSGIIAVVAAGIAHSFEPRAIAPSSARLSVVSTSVWSVLDFTLNGLVFLLLGTQLPYVMERVWTDTATNTNYLILFTVFILFVMLTLRFLWMLVMRRNTNLRRASEDLALELGASAYFSDSDEFEDDADDSDDEGEGEGEDEGGANRSRGFLVSDLANMDLEDMSLAERRVALEKHLDHRRQAQRTARSLERTQRKQSRRLQKLAARADQEYWKLHLVDALVLSLTGVRGAVTLAIVLSVPITLDGIQGFPERDLLIFLASAVILLSLVLANITLPFIVPKKKQAKEQQSELSATLDIFRKVIADLSDSSTEAEHSATSEVIRQYYQRIETLKSSNGLELPNETRVRHYVIELQLENTQRLTDNDEISSLTAYNCIALLSRQLTRVEHHSTLQWEVRALIDQFAHRWRMRRHIKSAGEPVNSLSQMVLALDLHSLQIKNYQYALEKLEALEPSEEFPAHTVGLIRNETKQRLERIQSRWPRGESELADTRREQSQMVSVQVRALYLERRAIFQAFEDGTISDKTAKTLRDNVALMELDIEEQLE